ncbi:MAG: EAL domain-containing protein [Sideroxyarcus sp.]|nr:EAL domain-containing protein [Sideroxyarcus sp.]
MKTTKIKTADVAPAGTLTQPPEFWRNIFDAVDDPVFLHDLQFRILLANLAYCREAGMSEAEAQGKPYWEVFPPGSAPSPGCLAAMQDSRFANSQEEIATGGKTFLSKGYKVLDGQGGILYALHALKDITAQKGSETALAESEERLRHAIDSARDAIISIDGASGAITAWNPAAAAMFGYSKEEALGRVLHDLLSPQRMRSVAQQAMTNFAAGGNGAMLGRTIELPALHRDGSEFPIELSLSSMHIRGKWQATGIVRDITERIRGQASEKRYRRLFETAKDGILILDAETGMIVDANPFITHLLGYTLEECLGKYIWDLRSLKNVAASKEKFLELQQQEYVRYEDIPLETSEGESRHVEFISNVYLVDNAKVIQCNIRDITRRWQAEEKNSRLSQMYRTISRCNEVLVRATDELELAHAMCRVLTEEGRFRMAWVGYIEPDAGKPIRIVATEGVDEQHLNDLELCCTGREHPDGIAGDAVKCGQPVVCHDIRNDIRCNSVLEQGVQLGYLSIAAIPIKLPRHDLGVLVVYGAQANEFSTEIINLLNELTGDLAFGIDNLRSKADRAAILEKLEHIAHYDALTALPNRVLLADRLQQAMAQTNRRRDLLAVAYLDLDGFKAVNDNHGHDAGDQLLMAMAVRMKDTLREGDTLARLGGDEFIVVLTGLDNIEACIPMLERLLVAAAQPVQVSDILLQVSASLGVTFYPQGEEVNPDQLLRQADQAMYQAKLSGKNRYHLFDDAQDRNVRGHHENLERIRLALINNEFVLHYQPKVNMRSGELVGAEALIRWQHPERGLLPPALFLPLIENHLLSVELGEWVIENALSQIDLWHAAGSRIPVSVNVGARQMQQPDFVERLSLKLAAHPGVKPGDLEMEVLETSALEDLAKSSRVIEGCGELGVQFALDDFGTGYSSLTYLKRLPFTLLKIDQSFVRDMLDDPDDLAILEAVLGLAVAFRRQVIAEGVETLKQGEMLLQLGCELAQGYGIAHPMAAAELPEWAAAWRTHPAWSNMPSFRRDDLSLLFASVEHQVWIKSVRDYIVGESRIVPVLDHHQCRFGAWLDAGGLIRHGEQLVYQDIEPVHQRVHDMATALCELKTRGRNAEALAGLDELTVQQDALQVRINALVQENRHWADKPWSHGDNTFALHDVV